MAKRRVGDRFAGPKIGQQDVLEAWMDRLTTDRGIHAETLVACLGSLTGFACTACLGTIALASGKPPEDVGVLRASTEDGREFWLGDRVNALMLEGEPAVWWQIAGTAAHNDPALPDPLELFRHVASTAGTPQFGVPRVPEGHEPAINPQDFVRANWRRDERLRAVYCGAPEEWPLLYVLAAQQAVRRVRGTLSPGVAAAIALECAAPMSKLDPRQILQSSP